ncbi:MAG: cytochrome c [Bacteroidota bacterium]
MKTRLRILLVSAFALTFTLSGCYNDNEEDLYIGSSTCDLSNVTYSGTIAPIFTAYCNSCHSGASPSGDIVTDNYTSVLAKIDRIRGCVNQLPGFSAMPQGGNKLSACELAKIDVWIAQGKPNN